MKKILITILIIGFSSIAIGGYFKQIEGGLLWIETQEIIFEEISSRSLWSAVDQVIELDPMIMPERKVQMKADILMLAQEIEMFKSPDLYFHNTPGSDQPLKIDP